MRKKITIEDFLNLEGELKPGMMVYSYDANTRVYYDMGRFYLYNKHDKVVNLDGDLTTYPIHSMYVEAEIELKHRPPTKKERWWNKFGSL